ncbi:MAG: S24/S26 family peptidase [Kineosporiaceae bacterium]
MRGRSMLPTLRDGDLLLVRRRRGDDLVGRLAVVTLPDRPLAVKRITAREPGGWWVERDNPAEGVDSWTVGAVPDPDVHAVVVARLWPAPALLRR